MQPMIFKMALSLALMVWLTPAGFAFQEQEYTIKGSGGEPFTLVLQNLNTLEVEGYEGNDIVVTSNEQMARPEKAQGLRSLSGVGEDNTQIGLNAITEGKRVSLSQVRKFQQGKYHIKVPFNTKLMIQQGNEMSSEIKVSKVKGATEVSTRYSSVHLEEVQGPLTVNSFSGNVNVVFSELSQQNPTSIISMHGEIDVTIPEQSKANINIESKYGEAFTDLDMDIQKSERAKKMEASLAEREARIREMRARVQAKLAEIEEKEKGNNEVWKEIERNGGLEVPIPSFPGFDFSTIMGTEVNGVLNGGGVRLYLQSMTRNIYLRKK